MIRGWSPFLPPLSSPVCVVTISCIVWSQVTDSAGDPHVPARLQVDMQISHLVSVQFSKVFHQSPCVCGGAATGACQGYGVEKQLAPAEPLSQRGMRVELRVMNNLAKGTDRWRRQVWR